MVLAGRSALAQSAPGATAAESSGEVLLEPIRVPAEFPAVDGVAPWVIVAPSGADASRSSPASSRDDSMTLARCSARQRVFFDEQEQIYRPCPDFGAAISAADHREDDGQPGSARCRAGEGTYFDRRGQIFRRCPASRAAIVAAARYEASSRASIRASTRASTTHPRCRAGDTTFWDAREQLFRLCDAPIAPSSTAGKPPNRRSPTPRTRCRPGDATYWDAREQLFRLCQ